MMGLDKQQHKKSNADLMDIIDDEKKNMLPFATFIFEFPVPGDNSVNIPPAISFEADTIHSRLYSRTTSKAHGECTGF